VKVAILAIGNEVLCGKIVDTNGAIISREIEKMGAKVVHREVVLDTVDDIVLGLNHAFLYADLVITIGGLGPTVDDLTRIGVADYFDEELVYDEAVFDEIALMFTSMGRVVTENNKQQAFRFKTGTVLKNDNGTAPGLMLKKDERQVFLLPGPPNELLPMFDKFVLPIIKEQVLEPVVSRSYRLHGIGESAAEDKIIHLYEKYQNLDIAPYCAVSYIDYVVSTKQVNESEIDDFEVEFFKILEQFYIGSAEVSLCARVVDELRKKKMMISVAESCTGGMLASNFIEIPGVSEVFFDGVVAYSNESKMARLGVMEQTLSDFGAVSSEVATEMALGILKDSKANVSVSITGVAGPDGGTSKKPVGTVYIGICINSDVFVEKFNFSGDREKIRNRAMNQALYELFKRLIDHKETL